MILYQIIKSWGNYKTHCIWLTSTCRCDALHRNKQGSYQPLRGLASEQRGSYLCPDTGLVFLSRQMTRIFIRTKDSNFCPDKGLVFVSGQISHICVRIKDMYLYADKWLEFLSGQRTHICVRKKRLVFVTATESCAFRTHKFAEAQMLREVLVLNQGTTG